MPTHAHTYTHMHTCSARFIRPLSQRTAFSGIWLIFLFVYKYTADTAANILQCVELEGDEVDKRHFIQLVRKHHAHALCTAVYMHT